MSSENGSATAMPPLQHRLKRALILGKAVSLGQVQQRVYVIDNGYNQCYHMPKDRFHSSKNLGEPFYIGNHQRIG